MAALNNWVNHTFGSTGMYTLSLIVGFTDIDPFALSLLTGQFKADDATLAGAIIIADGANNLLKAVYAWWFGHRDTGYLSGLWLSLSGLITISWGYCGCFT